VIRSGNSLEVFRGGELVFSSEKKWLHPLFDLEKFLAGGDADPGDLFLEDKIIGRGAAFLIVRMGIRKVRTALLSRLGLDVFRSHGTDVSWETLVDTITCRTEELLRDEDDPEAAYALLKARAEAASAGV